MNKPTPVSKWIVCSVCDLDWNAHGPSPTLMDCVRLLKARGVYQPYPHYPTYVGGVRYGINTTNAVSGNNVEYRTPKES